MSSRQARNVYENIGPGLLIPDHYICNQSSKMVAIYDEPLGEESDSITLMFPGNLSGASQQRINTKRVGTRTIVFDTPAYSTSRGMVEVSPILKLANGQAKQLKKFNLTLKHPLTNVMELCMKLSTSNAVLPVLMTLMMHTDEKRGKDQFTDPHTDRMMTLLVGSMKPGESGAIKHILIPNKKWKKMNLADVARKFGLRNMEKESYMLNTQRKRTAKSSKTAVQKQDDVAEAETSPSDTGYDKEEVSEGLQASFSSPAINTIGLDSEDIPGAADVIFMTNQMQNDKKRVGIVIQDFQSREPSRLSLKVGQRVYIITRESSETGCWYGACDGRHGYFPAECVNFSQELEEIRQPYTPPLTKKLPLPPLPKKQPLPKSFVDKRLSVHADSRNDRFKRTQEDNPTGQLMEALQTQIQHRTGQTRPKLYTEREAYRQSPQSHDQVTAISRQHQNQQLGLDSSGDYVDMVAYNSSSDSCSESESAEEPPPTTQQCTNAVPRNENRSFLEMIQSRQKREEYPQRISPGRDDFTPPYRQRIGNVPTGQRPVRIMIPKEGQRNDRSSRIGPIPPVRVMSNKANSSSQAGKAPPPAPPVRVSSIPKESQTQEFESTESEEEVEYSDQECSSDEEDKFDYVNMSKQGLPLPKTEFQHKYRYENFDPTEFDLVKGHVYDRPQDSNEGYPDASLQGSKSRTHSIKAPYAPRLPKEELSLQTKSNYQDASSTTLRNYQLSEPYSPQTATVDYTSRHVHTTPRVTHESVTTCIPHWGTQPTKKIPPSPRKPRSRSYNPTTDETPSKTPMIPKGIQASRLQQELALSISPQMEKKVKFMIKEREQRLNYSENNPNA